MKKRGNLAKKAFERDNFACQKCKIQDKSLKILEAHHLIPLCYEGKDDIDNLITLCADCHHYAPDKKEEFDEYMGEECDGTMTTLIKAFKKVRLEHKEVFDKLDKK